MQPQQESALGLATRRKFKGIPDGLITTRQSKSPDWKFFGYNHVEFIVSNPKQSAEHYCTRYGFVRIAYKGLETGSRDVVSHVVRQNEITIVFTGPYKPQKSIYSKFLSIHGDAVRDQAYSVTNAEKIYRHAINNGAKIIKKLTKISDNYGSMLVATFAMYGNVTATIVENVDYRGPFMPGYASVSPNDDILQNKLDRCGLQRIDHIVGAQPENGDLLVIAEKFSLYFGFHVFWSADSKDVRGDISALRTIIMTDYDCNCKQPVIEPAYDDGAKGLSQVEEFLIYNGEPGVQHIAVNTFDIISAIKAMKSRGTKFLTIGDDYYKDLRKRLNAQNNIQVKEDIDILQKLNILVDFDENGYLLQIFTEVVQDRPTLFIELIQRENHDGFGKGNFNALFGLLEGVQVARGNRFRNEELSYKPLKYSKL